MANERYNDYVDRLERMFQTANDHAKQAIIQCLYNYQDTCLKGAKWAGQRSYCRNVIFKLVPDFARLAFPKDFKNK